MRTSSVLFRFALASIACSLLSGCVSGEPTGTSAATLAVDFTGVLADLLRDAEHTADRLAATADGPRTAATFDLLETLRGEMARAAPGEPALSIWSADGTPQAWAGAATRSHPDSRAAFAVHVQGGRTWLVARTFTTDGTVVAARGFDTTSPWNPARRPHGGRPIYHARYVDTSFLPAPLAAENGAALLAPDGSTMGVLEPIASAAPPARGAPVGWLATLAIAAIAMVLIGRAGRHPDPTSLRAGAFSCLLLGTARGLGLAFAGGGTGVFSGASLHGSLLLFGLFRSPLDVLSTGITLLASAALLAPTLRRAQGAPGPRRLLGAVLTGLVVATVILVFAVSDDSQMNLLLAMTGANAAPRVLVQAGLLFALWSPMLLLGTCARRHDARPVTTAALALVAAGLGFFGAVSVARAHAREDLVQHNLRLPLLGHQSDRLHALDLSSESLRADTGLPARLIAAVQSGRTDELAWSLWSSTQLARRGYRSSLEIFGAEGILRGAFGIEMRPPVPAGDQPIENLHAVEAARIVFSTLSQEAPVYTSRWPIIDNDQVVGGIALYVSDEVDNVPALQPDRTLWHQAVPGFEAPDFAEQFGGAPVAMVRGQDNRLLWSAHTDPPRPPTGFDADSVPPEGVWIDTESGGHPVRLLHFGDGTHLYSLGFHRDDLLDRVGRLFRVLPLLLTIGWVTLATALVLVRRPRGLLDDLQHAGRRLRGSFASKLVAASLLASLVPLLMLALVLRGSLATQRQENLAELGVQTLGVAERVVRDTLAAAADAGDSPLPDDETLFWISRIIRQEIDLFFDGSLAATSRRGLYASGFLPALPDAAVYRRIVLNDEQSVLSPASRFDTTAVSISGPLDVGATQPAILSLSLDLQQAEVDHRIRAVRELTDLATVTVALLLVGASIVVGRGMSGRLRGLTQATERLAAGDEPEPVAVRSSDEVGRLTRSFNAMAVTLAEQRSALQRRTRTLEQILLHAPAGIVSLDAEQRIATINPAALRILQTTTAAVPDIPLTRLTTDSVYAAGLLELMRESPAANEVHEVDLLPTGGGEERVRAIVVSLPSPVGGRLLILEDITQTVRSNRLAAWAEMARSIAHEIKNPLTPIRLSAEHLRRVHAAGDPALDTTLVATVETILSQVETLREIASDFSLYARIPALVRRPVVVSSLVNDVVAPYQGAAPDNVRFVLTVSPDLPTLDLDERLVRRALVNLVENALQAMPDGGTLTVTARLDPEAASGGVRIEVSDTGTGMDSRTVERLFEPYFSTREAGTGLGLPIARRAIDGHGGRLDVESTPGAGTSFTVTLPARAPAENAGTHTSPAGVPAPDRGTP